MKQQRFAITGADVYIDRAAKYANDTGNCPVCRVRKCGVGITCGEWECLRKRLPGNRDEQRRPR